MVYLPTFTINVGEYTIHGWHAIFKNTNRFTSRFSGQNIDAYGRDFSPRRSGVLLSDGPVEFR